MSTRVLTYQGAHRFFSGKQVDEPLGKEGKEMAKYWENTESVSGAQEQFQEEIVHSAKCCLKVRRDKGQNSLLEMQQYPRNRWFHFTRSITVRKC